MTAKKADPRRRAAYRRGRWSEALCRLSLRLRGYHILARGWRSPLGEIDIVARRDSVLAIVEVKARRDLATAGEALSVRQQRRLERAAAAFVARHPDLGTLPVRFDLMLVVPWRWPHHIADAWRTERY
jgi:putative endonuclease